MPGGLMSFLLTLSGVEKAFTLQQVKPKFNLVTGASRSSLPKFYLQTYLNQ